MNSTKIDISKKIVWLASYPKSGNTWFRAFLTALMNNGELNINEIKTNGMFSSRQIFSAFTDIDSTYLYDEEAKILQPEVFNQLSNEYEQERTFIKVHDAYTFNSVMQPIIPTQGTLCAIYFIRNPLDIAGSLANHNSISIDTAVNSLIKDDFTLARQDGNFNNFNQFRQFLSNWSFHVESWTSILPFPVKVIKYEDMVQNPYETFSKAIDFLGLSYNPESIYKAIEASSFNNLKQQELANKFKEVLSIDNPFFRKGSINNWEDELNKTQISLLAKKHKKIMTLFNY